MYYINKYNYVLFTLIIYLYEYHFSTERKNDILHEIM